MRGLLIKDFRLLLNRRQSFLIFAAMSIIISFSTDSSFLLVYFPFVMISLALGTISYDKLDNGFSYLFTLPVSRKLYIQSKYLLMGIVALISMVVAIIGVSVINTIQGNEFSITTNIVSMVAMIPAFVLVISIMLPLHFKFGIEKIRTVSMIMYGIVIGIGVIVSAIAQKLNINMERIEQIINNLNEYVLSVVLIVVVVGIWNISYIISLKIMKNKEF